MTKLEFQLCWNQLKHRLEDQMEGRTFYEGEAQAYIYYNEEMIAYLRQQMNKLRREYRSLKNK